MTNITDGSGIADGIYLVKEMASSVSGLSSPNINELIVNYNHDFIDDKDDPIQYYLLQADPFVPLVISSKPIIKGTPERLNELNIVLAEKYSELLEDFTRNNIGGIVAIVIDGEAVTRHKIRTAVTGGRLKITRCTDHACESLFTALIDNIE